MARERGESKRRRVAHVMSNLDADGNPMIRISPAANYHWHTDKPYRPAPPIADDAACGRGAAAGGGPAATPNSPTWRWPTTRCPSATKRRIAGLRVAFRPAFDPSLPAVDHPLVRTHPETGRKSLYFGNHATHIVGLPQAESAAAARRTARARDTAAIRLCPSLAARRSRDVGQPRVCCTGSSSVTGCAGTAASCIAASFAARCRSELAAAVVAHSLARWTDRRVAAEAGGSQDGRDGYRLHRRTGTAARYRAQVSRQRLHDQVRARDDGDRGRRHAGILAPARRERLARHHLPRGGRRQRARPHRSGRADGGDRPRRDARPLSGDGAARRRGDRRGRLAGATPRVAAAHRRRARPRRRSPGPSRTPAGTPPGSPRPAREAGGGFTLSGTQDVRARRASRRCASSSRRAPATAARWRTASACSSCRRTRAGLGVKLLPAIDETRKLCEVRFDNVALPAGALLGELHRGWAPLSRVVDRAAVALSAEMCGAAQRVLDMTVEYAKMRVAFGKPIGSYQGVKHKCADMLVEIENAKSLTYYAAWAVDEGDPDAVAGGVDGQGRGVRCRAARCAPPASSCMAASA